MAIKDGIFPICVEILDHDITTVSVIAIVVLIGFVIGSSNCSMVNCDKGFATDCRGTLGFAGKECNSIFEFCMALVDESLKFTLLCMVNAEGFATSVTNCRQMGGSKPIPKVCHAYKLLA